jgi:hypothetical protein
MRHPAPTKAVDIEINSTGNQSLGFERGTIFMLFARNPLSGTYQLGATGYLKSDVVACQQKDAANLVSFKQIFLSRAVSMGPIQQG